MIAAGWELGRDVRDNLPNLAGEWFPGRDPPTEAVELLNAARLAP
jgi:hypothetical protein